jgi:membrane protein DedA with SNARE-associated domain
MIDGLLDAIADAGLGWIVVAAFGFAFAETALFLDLIVPGEVGLVVVGAAGERADAPLPLLIGVATVGAIAGDTVSYLVGRHYGERLVRRWEPVRVRVEPAVGRAKEYFGDRGGSAVFFGRFVGALRAVVPFVAGMGRMTYGRFLAWNVLASVAWTGIVVSLGYFIGSRIRDDVDRIGLLISVVVVAALVTYFLVRRRRKRAEASAA